MPTRIKAPSEVFGIINNIIALYHPDLKEHGVKIDAMMVLPSIDKKTGDPKPGPVLKDKSGNPAAATIKPRSANERAELLGDALILIDDELFRKMPPPVRDALIDHELTHLAVKTEISKDEQGREVEIALRDDYGRPKLSSRLHDYTLTGFHEIFDRHGESSLEFHNLAKLGRTNRAAWMLDAMRQTELPLFDDDVSVTLETNGKVIQINGGKR